MYAVIDNAIHSKIQYRIIAYHEKLRVVERYKELIENNNPTIEYSIIRCKLKLIKEKPNYYDYYLIPYADGYIQSGYSDLVLHDHTAMIHDYEFTIDILKRILEFDDSVSGKKRKHIRKTIEVIEEMIDIENESIPNITTLEQLEDMKNRYTWATSGYYDHEPEYDS